MQCTSGGWILTFRGSGYAAACGVPCCGSCSGSWKISAASCHPLFSLLPSSGPSVCPHPCCFYAPCHPLSWLLYPLSFEPSPHPAHSSAFCPPLCPCLCLSVCLSLWSSSWTLVLFWPLPLELVHRWQRLLLFACCSPWACPAAPSLLAVCQCFLGLRSTLHHFNSQPLQHPTPPA